MTPSFTGVRIEIKRNSQGAEIVEHVKVDQAYE